MNKKNIYVSMAALTLALALGFSSCNNNENNRQTSKEPKNAAEARELAASRIWSETPDTVFLDYHWGMSEKEVKAMTARYVKEKKLQKERYFDYYNYTMTLPNVGDVVFSVVFNFNNDSLHVITLVKNWLDGKDVDFSDVVTDFSDILKDKGYTYFYEENNPYFNTSSHDFFRGNTTATFVNYQQSEAIVFENEYVMARVRRETAAKQEAERQKAMKENEQKSNISRNDF